MSNSSASAEISCRHSPWIECKVARYGDILTDTVCSVWIVYIDWKSKLKELHIKTWNLWVDVFQFEGNTNYAIFQREMVKWRVTGRLHFPVIKWECLQLCFLSSTPVTVCPLIGWSLSLGVTCWFIFFLSSHPSERGGISVKDLYITSKSHNITHWNPYSDLYSCTYPNLLFF